MGPPGLLLAAARRRFQGLAAALCRLSGLGLASAPRSPRASALERPPRARTPPSPAAHPRPEPPDSPLHTQCRVHSEHAHTRTPAQVHAHARTHGRKCKRTHARFRPERGQAARLRSPSFVCLLVRDGPSVGVCAGTPAGASLSPGPDAPSPQDTLTEISEWLERHPREVVILACRGFEGLTEELHEYLVACVRNIFGHMLCPRGEVPTLRQLWARGQQVLLSYEDERTLSRHRELWPGLPYWWADQAKPTELVRYLEHMKSCGRPGGLFVAGINLTENLEYVLVHPAGSLRKMTLPHLAYLTAWVREQSPGPGARCTNVIAGDFVGADSFISDVIRLNEKLLPC
nr:PREDICTED: PI-PLC X domain-containing protein 1-like [Equus przewalskii]